MRPNRWVSSMSFLVGRDRLLRAGSIGEL
jgi:hypothetical protein